MVPFSGIGYLLVHVKFQENWSFGNQCSNPQQTFDGWAEFITKSPAGWVLNDEVFGWVDANCFGGRGLVEMQSNTLGIVEPSGCLLRQSQTKSNV